MERVLLGLRRYQEAPRPPLPPLMPVIAKARGSVLRDYGGDGADVLFIPSLINPPNVLDLRPERSLLRWLAAHGHRVTLLDWGADISPRQGLSVANHVEQIVLPMLRLFAHPPALVGYCLGGTMAVAAARLAPVRGLATLAAPWAFSGFSDDARSALAQVWTTAQPSVETLGLLPMEALQSVFWSLDPQRTIAKFEGFAGMETGSAEHDAFVTLEDWANDGPPLPGPAAREMFESFFAGDTPGSGQWSVGGLSIDPRALTCPQYHIVSTADRIVPLDSAIPVGDRLEVGQGHVGMVVGGKAEATIWQPLARWLSQCSIG